eukprot:UN4970
MHEPTPCHLLICTTWLSSSLRVSDRLRSLFGPWGPQCLSDGPDARVLHPSKVLVFGGAHLRCMAS